MTTTKVQLDARSLEIRRAILRAVDGGRRGHIGSAFSLAEIVRVLYDDVMHFDPKRPHAPERDRFILSKGHGCLALYALLADKGFFPQAELDRFCKADGELGGHPEHRVAGVEFSTGSLGHGLPVAVGMCLGLRMAKRNSRVYVALGDGECNEGSVWESAMYAAKYRLDRLCAIVDYNKMTTYASTREVLDLEPFRGKWESFGFAVREVDGHDVPALRDALGAIPFEAGRPSAVIAHTIKGKGVASIENVASWHHKAKVSDADMAMLRKGLEAH